jgi:hypothetical protein
MSGFTTSGSCSVWLIVLSAPIKSAKKEEGRRKKEEGRRKKEEGRRKKEAVYKI